jgi:hypothetical protein
MKVHIINCWSAYFKEVLAGTKQFELREDDRGYQVGDALILREYDPGEEVNTGRICFQRIEYILVNFPGLQEGYVAMSISQIEGNDQIMVLASLIDRVRLYEDAIEKAIDAYDDQSKVGAMDHYNASGMLIILDGAKAEVLK